MAGVVTRGKSGRKQWTLHDGPRGSLRRLRNQLANDGCPESQVVLAKQLFDEECELEIDKEENAKLAVYWLIKASEQGNCEATELLNKCLLTGKGITEHNYLDVKSCINMTQEEKIARKAAREMFASLSNGEDFITSEQLQKRMLEIQSQFHNRKITHSNELENGTVNNINDFSHCENWSNRVDTKNEKLTEDHLVTAAISYSHGYLPIVNRVLSLTEPNLNALDHIPFMQRSVLHPWLAIRIIYFKLIKYFGRRTFLTFLPFNRTDFQLLLLLIYSLFSTENIVLFIPTILYYGSFLFMIVLTFQIMQNSRDFIDFRVWSCLFLTYSSGILNSQESEYQFIRNNLKPYGQFFFALIVNLLMYPLLEQWIPESEITIISFCLTFMSLLTFLSKKNKYPDILMLLSFAVNVLAKYPYEIDPVVTQSWRFLDLKIPTFASYIIVNGIEFCLNFRLLFYIIIPVIFIYLCARENWNGIYKYFIPHCVTLSWLQVILIHSQSATMFGLLRGTLGIVGCLLFLPLVGMTTILLPAFAVAKFLVNNNVFYCFSIFIIIASIGVLLLWLLSKTRFVKYIGLFQILFGLCAVYFLMYPHLKNHSVDVYSEKSKISWQQYENVCHQINWDESNIAKTQLNCFKLENTIVNWNGYINEIKLKSIKNTYKYIINKLPDFVQNYLYCYFGDLTIDYCQQTNKLLQQNCQIINEFIKNENKCTLDKLNTYEYEISVRMQSGIWGKTSEIILIADNNFTNFTIQLKPNDKIYFNGYLFNNFDLGPDGIIGGLKPHVMLTEIGCLACHNLNLTKYKILKKTTDFKVIVSMLNKGMKYVLNILLNPIIVFK